MFLTLDNFDVCMNFGFEAFKNYEELSSELDVQFLYQKILVFRKKLVGIQRVMVISFFSKQ